MLEDYPGVASCPNISVLEWRPVARVRPLQERGVFNVRICGSACLLSPSRLTPERSLESSAAQEYDPGVWEAIKGVFNSTLTDPTSYLLM